ncbi:SAVED domain-containing protein [Deinococcus budaensis]|uniref:SMODS-associated and fused to various effectors domain-containing protein n=1 Tax=Deinococcus budaensis TaxID=1665626 RepID=A0A7W8LNX8_9DEIO|nr:SAVED domain-containing protein [Deinococcus budaensis]MBB5232970.1 hypothetical protein [Deinococcus budaensis]
MTDVQEKAKPRKKKVEKKPHRFPHQNISGVPEIMLWAAAAGRCEICNESLTRHPHTQRRRKRGEKAHIVGQGQSEARTPRFDSTLSPKLAKDPSNIMLLCQTCHEAIDAEEEQWTVETLRAMKQAHEERIARVTGGERRQARVALFTTPIPHGVCAVTGAAQYKEWSFTDEALHDAVLPRFFPDRETPARVDVRVSAGEADRIDWAAVRQEIRREHVLRVKGDRFERLSVFGLGMIPALIAFGQEVGDMGEVYVHNVRNGMPQAWSEHDVVGYDVVVSGPVEAVPAEDVVVCLSLTGPVEPGQYGHLVQPEWPVYTLANPEGFQRPNWLEAENQLRRVTRRFAELLARIQMGHGQGARVHLLPAVPPPVALDLGRHYRPNHHPRVHVYNCVDRKFHFAFELGGTR